MLAVGQVGIRFREAVLAGETAAALGCLPELDAAHHVELLLGAALRDARDDFAAAHLYLRGDWPGLVARLITGPPDLSRDRLAAAYVAAGRAPARWQPEGRPLDRDVRQGFPDVHVAAALQAGVGGWALLAAFTDLPLHPAVDHYYRVGTLHALGCRPLLVLASTAAPA